jgi:hypothetical protein
MMEQLLPPHLLPEELRQAAGQRFLAYQLAHQTPFQVNPEGEWRAIERMLNPKKSFLEMFLRVFEFLVSPISNLKEVQAQI